MVKLFFAIFLSVLISNKVLGASNNLFFTSAQLISYCKSDNLYEQGICDGYIIAVNDVITVLIKKKLTCVFLKIYQLKILDYLLSTS